MQNSSNPDLIVNAITPLYRFTSDSPDISIGNLFRLVASSEDLLLHFESDDIFVRHWQVCQPDYVLWQTSAKAAVSELIQTPEDVISALDSSFMVPAMNLFRLLRLFKPGRLFAGDTFVVFKNATSSSWATQFSRRTSLTNLDVSLLPHRDESYELRLEEVPFLETFGSRLSSIFDSLNESPSALPHLEMALHLLGRDDGPDSDVLNALTAFEGLLTNESNVELSYRLSLRVANLLGCDPASRKQIFRNMKAFYDLRSKLIHGSGFKLKAKQQMSLQQVATLREYLRRTILSVAALNVRGFVGGPLDSLLDDIALDDARRTEIQGFAAEFLHVTPASTGLPVC